MSIEEERRKVEKPRLTAAEAAVIAEKLFGLKVDASAVKELARCVGNGPAAMPKGSRSPTWAGIAGVVIFAYPCTPPKPPRSYDDCNFYLKAQYPGEKGEAEFSLKVSVCARRVSAVCPLYGSAANLRLSLLVVLRPCGCGVDAVSRATSLGRATLLALRWCRIVISQGSSRYGAYVCAEPSPRHVPARPLDTGP